MDNYIDLLRNIVKNFKYSNEFDDIIKRILDKLFNNYYVNRGKYIYNIDNLYKKYDISKYNFIKKKYRISKKEDLIFRFNRYDKKLLKENYEQEQDDFKIILNKRFCLYIPCYNKIVGSYNYCHLHNENTI